MTKVELLKEVKDERASYEYTDKLLNAIVTKLGYTHLEELVETLLQNEGDVEERILAKHLYPDIE